MTTYKISSVKGSTTITGTIEQAIEAAVEMECDLQPAYGVTIELDGETVAEVRDGKVEREDETTAQTTAEQVASEMDVTGDSFTSRDGRSLHAVCRSHGAEVYRDEQGERSYRFSDGSAIATSGPAWDVIHADCECGWCWAARPRGEPHCDERSGSEYRCTISDDEAHESAL